MHPQRGRIAAVFGSRQGSGYLLMPWLVLTAAHLVPDGTAEVVVPGGTGRVRCRVVWSRYTEQADVALLAADQDLAPDPGPAPGWIRVEDLTPRPGTVSVGYPSAQRDRLGELDSEQLTGTLKPGSSLLRRLHVLDSGHTPPTARGGGSPWAGFSGSAVFHQGRLAGVVRADPGDQWQHGRVELTPATTLLDDPEFIRACERNGARPDAIRSLLPDADDFEQHLRRVIAEQSDSVQIFGLSSRGWDQESWALDASYLSLELVDGGEGAVARRAEQALAGRDRVLIRGHAGSGKTTLLQWLATCVARRALPPSLADLDGLVPLLIRLRTVPANIPMPQPEDFLSYAVPALAGRDEARGWVTRQLLDGRLLLLVDGVDEIPQEQRVKARQWLIGLLTAFPRCRFVITTRPAAVQSNWLANQGFSDLELLPMTPPDIVEFIARWHRAAARGNPDDAHLAVWRHELATAVTGNRDLARLATNPLLCALICALNRDRRGYLPHGRMELYAAALDLLLQRRDDERGVRPPTDLGLLPSHPVQLLQRLAYWLVRNYTSEMSYEQALHIVKDALPALRGVRAEPEQLLDHLIDRSGLLRQLTADSVDFIHRTFQDFLAARAAVQDEDLGMLAVHAEDDQWEDVIRMAVWHAGPAARSRLLDRMLRQARARPRLAILAMTCLPYASELAPGTRQRVEREMEGLIPPRDLHAAASLSRAGGAVIGLLPGPPGLDDATAEAVVQTAVLTGDPAALPLLSRFADHPAPAVRRRLAGAWSRFDARDYGEQVIARLPVDDLLTVSADSPAQVAAIGRNGGRPRIELVGQPTRDTIDRLVPEQLDTLRLRADRAAIDLRPLSDRTALRDLSLYGLYADLSPLAGLPLRSLRLLVSEIGHHTTLGTLDQLETLVLRCALDGSGTGRWRADLPPSLVRLRLSIRPWLPQPLDLSRLRRLEHLEIFTETIPPRRRAALAQLPRLSTLVVEEEMLGLLGDGPRLPGITRLVLHNAFGTGLLSLTRCYPSLEVLTMYQHNSPAALDLSGLAGLPRLRRIELRGYDRAVGGERLGGVTVDRDPRTEVWGRPSLSLASAEAAG